MFIPDLLKEKVKKWKENGFPCDYPELMEILQYEYFQDNDGNQIPHFLRQAQAEALETYWYLRVIEKTPHVKELYERLIPKPSDLLNSLEISLPQEELTDLLLSGTIETIFKKIKNDDEFVRKHNLETVRETITLQYPSYILALAMGSGKTLLIGTIIAVEFCLSLEYPNDNFVKNALVFAPGKTILGALKQISEIPFNKILPPKFYQSFLGSMKITYTNDGQKELLVGKNSSYNIVVTNTEKIRIQKSSNKKQITLLDFKEKEKQEQEEEIANLRLQTLASLPNLAIFSDEGHHTYGQSLDSELKKVRKTVDYLASHTNVLCVINTTGTPYFKKQMLKDVIYWYGLSQGIKDGILKEVRDNVESYPDISIQEFVKRVLKDFFDNYKSVTIYDGSKAKIALYFPKIDDIDDIKPVAEETLMKLGINTSTILVVHSKSDDEIKDLFNNRINEISNPYRVYLLVNMGTEGWNCPSLFATALARKLTTSNNFILQAASRCLRQTPGNKIKAKIYLSKENVAALDTQLQETYNETLTTVISTTREMIRDRIVVRKLSIPPILLKKKIRKVVTKNNNGSGLNLTKPTIRSKTYSKTTYKIEKIPESKKLLREINKETFESDIGIRDIFEVSVELSSIFRLDTSKIFDILSQIYPSGDIPDNHVPDLTTQIEKQLQNWSIEEEDVEVALMIIKPEGFEEQTIENGKVYASEIMYKKSRESLFLTFEKMKNINSNDFSFHYSPYNFDSMPEKDFLIRMLELLNEDPDDVEDIYFTGGLSNQSQTDIIFEYKDNLGVWRNYTPDFIIKKKNGKILIVEVKKERARGDPIEGERGFKAMALYQIEETNKNKIKYKMMFTDTDEIGFDNIKVAKKWIYGE